ncbi:GGDEF and EAL domain-containing protein [Bacillus niameyensis]|uniref:GGDEF and EAL domain-containing protein n=1 Tax=Bacillus niameyensis TaxID=1522308 RepID=UPI0007848E44|nr:GGDEF and EAL domain-containing protein [Bacillus niameyensis]
MVGNFFRRLARKKKERSDSQEEIFNIYQYVFHHFPDPVYILNEKEEILVANASFNNLFDIPPKSLRGIIKKSKLKTQLNSFYYYYEKTLKGESQSFTSNNFVNNNDVVEMENTLYPIYINGRIIGIVGLMNDSSKSQKHLEPLNTLALNLQTEEKVTNIGIWEYDLKEDTAYWSDKMYEIFGLDEHTFKVPTYDKVFPFIHPDDQPLFQEAFNETIEKGIALKVKHRIVRPDGTVRVVSEYADIIINENQKTIRLIGTTHDITDQQLIQDKWALKDEQRKNFVRHLDAYLWSKDMQTNQLLFISPGFERLTGFSTGDFLHHRIEWEDLIVEEDFESYEKVQERFLDGEFSSIQYRISNKAGDLRWVHDKTIPTLDSTGNLLRLDGIIIDITEEKITAEKIKYLAYHDYLTHLPNRRMFDQELQDHVDKTKSNFAIMYLDMDGFKKINDSLGHSIGDRLLTEFAYRLKQCVTGDNLVARMGGDEFSILIRKVSNMEEPVKIAKELIQILEEPYFIEGYELQITASIGIAIYPDDGDNPESLVKKADAALYRAKAAGKNTYKIYNPSMDIESFKTYYLERDLRKAIQKNQLFLYYQPKVETHTCKIIGAEALIRWQHPEWKSISPMEFIPLAEETGMIFPITDWVIRTVCEQIKKWEQLGLPLKTISLNISPKHISREDWVEKIIQTLQETKINPKWLELEITETALIEKGEAFTADIERLKKIGVKLALDDFGTGYSSLLFLKKFKVDTIKIDKSFITEHTSRENSQITKAIISLAHDLDMNVVAEGVETWDQLSFLRKYECDQIQGYLFSKPLPYEEFEKLLILPNLPPQEIDGGTNYRKGI